MESPLILPSIMCAKPWEIRDYVREFELAGVDAIHFDVMDGHYVPNVMCSSEEFLALRSLSSMPIDVHLMATEPEHFIDYFKFSPGDWASFHPEVCHQPYRLLMRLREMGLRTGYAISPAVSCDYVEDSLAVLDFVVVMAINPGFKGQCMTPDHLSKLARIRDIVASADHHIDIVVDGNTVVENAKHMLSAGATGLIVGTSTLMKDGPEGFLKNYEHYLEDLSWDGALT